MNRPNKSVQVLVVFFLIVLLVFNVILLYSNSSEEQPIVNEPEVIVAVSEDNDEEDTQSAKEELRRMNIGAGIQADGMSVSRTSLSAVELGIVDCNVYCKDKYQIIPLCGESLTWTSSDESIAEVDGNGLVNTLKAGSVVITATDANGNQDSCVINVVKVVYVTIDDTPTKYTPKLLDILDEYGVKATFFMNADPNEAEQYVEIYKRGHTFALHGYNHYTKYDDGADFLDNMEKCRQFLIETTGCDSVDNLIRFPTGSKGQKRYREILDYIQAEDYSAFDWTTEFHDYYYHSAEECLDYFKQHLKHDRAIFLFHPRKWSVEALPEALEYLKEQGYTTAVITQDTMQYNFYGAYPS